MQTIIFTKTQEIECKLIATIPTVDKFNVIRKEEDRLPHCSIDLAILDLNWEDSFIHSTLKQTNAPAIAIVQFESPEKLARAHLSGVKTAVLLENIQQGLMHAMQAVLTKKAMISPAAAKSMLKLLKSRDCLTKNRLNILSDLSYGKSQLLIAQMHDMDINYVTQEMWDLCNCCHHPDVPT